VEAALFYNLYQTFIKKPWYRELEIGWIGDYKKRNCSVDEGEPFNFRAVPLPIPIPFVVHPLFQGNPA